MKKLISLILLVAVFGIAFADVSPMRKVVRPPVNSAQQSISQPGVLGPWLRVMLRVFIPSYRLVEPLYSEPPLIVPDPPVCGLACRQIPVQRIAE